MNPFFNTSEGRLRAGFRIPIYIVIVFILMGLGHSIPLDGWQYIITTVLSFGFFWMTFRFVDNRASLTLAGIKPDNNWWKEFGIGCGIAALVMTFIFVIQTVTGTIEFLGFSWELPGSSSWMYPVIVFFVQMLCVGFYEEIMSRSYLIPNFKEGVTFWRIDPKKATLLAIIFSSSFFGIAHALNPNATLFALLNIFMAGVMLAIPYVITGRLAYSVGIHFAWNFFQGGVFGFRVSGQAINGSLIQIQQGGEQIWTGSSFGPEGGLIGTFGIVIVTALSLIAIKLKGEPLQLHQNFTKSYLEFENEEKKKTELD